MRARLFPFLLTALLGASGCVNGVFYQPNHVVYQTPAAHGLPFEAVTFPTAGGAQLSGWFIPAVGTARGTVLHVHGNAQNMTAHFGFVDWLPAEGYHVFVFDYRGYGASPGSPSRRAAYEDTCAALRYVAARDDVDPEKLLVLGQSLGGANAIAALARQPLPGVRGIVIDSAFASYRTIVRDKAALIPVVAWLRWPLSYLVVSNGYSPDHEIPRLPPVPLLILHGTRDMVVPYRHAEILFARAQHPKSLWIVNGGNHTDAFGRFRSQYRQPLLDFFAAALITTPPAPAP